MIKDQDFSVPLLLYEYNSEVLLLPFAFCKFRFFSIFSTRLNFVEKMSSLCLLVMAFGMQSELIFWGLIYQILQEWIRAMQK